MAPSPGPRLTIGQAASYAGVTTRAVRHYHQVGLLAEPPRDHSGYRRYSARDVIDLIRIRALAEAGVPLNRVGELLSADPDELATAVAEIDEQLQTEIHRLQDHRAAVKQLATIDGLALPDEVVAYLDHLRGLGFRERVIGVERDSWVIVNAQIPDKVVEWMEAKWETIEDPQFLAAYRGLEAAFDWDPDDPRLDDLADELSDLFTRALAEHGDSNPDEIDDTVVAMLDAEFVGRSPAWLRVTELLEKRGWSGWTNIEPAAHRDR
jgi:DNA-binding transcriptional MerR regulator